ncbi:4-amino-4-deoxy-L-arabinose transferase [Robiginitalea myxolifaciens]|uniref:4-amino-4-deoxy-L-arabinose transferase n=1 Tax=Robiginitalea myxolifaciens TaxID=400055 RepID=A0A1I6G7B6_9FLAO|nr:glycosyltransferase family 39 protein [Robiginitalea myxolifaciens]SFR38083.1 4-amino-4-deoxy-L-arabinose transferase [Robiginitalea myxolifaciens]
MNRDLKLVPNRRWVFPLLFLAAFLIRFPFFFRDYVDRDESTFILVGQAWVDGFLPYTELWDVKPPLTFLFFAGIIYLFGKSFIAIRLAGTLVVAVTAWFTYDLTRRETNRGWGFTAGMGCVMLFSLFGSIQGVMSEHLLMAAYMGGLWFLITQENTLGRLLAGILFGIALMIKINAALPLLLAGGWWAIQQFRGYTISRAIGHLLTAGIPGILVIAMTLFPYWQAGKTQLWWDSVIQAPLAYTEGSASSPLGVWGLTLAVMALLLWGLKSTRIRFGHTPTALFLLTVVGVLWSFIQSGRANTHYLIQLYPALLILLAAFPGRKFNDGIRNYRWALVLLIALIPVESYLEYANIIKNKQEKGTYFNGEGFTVPAYIQAEGLESEKILFLRYHIGYWVLDERPPVKTATHPSNLCKDEMFPYYNPERSTSEQELKYLMETIQPPLVITRKGRKAFDRDRESENAYMDRIFEQYYRLRDTVDQAAIWERTK